MKSISAENAIAILNERQATGSHVDSRLRETIGKRGALFLVTLEDEASFLSLIWHDIDASRLLTPENSPRTLKDVATRLLKARHTFRDLAKNLGHARQNHHPKWFEPCVSIDEEFSFDRFGWVAIAPASDNEQSGSSFGTFYVYDGGTQDNSVGKATLGERRELSTNRMLAVGTAKTLVDRVSAAAVVSSAGMIRSCQSRITVV